MSQYPSDRCVTAGTPLRALIFEDNSDDIELSLRTLRASGFAIVPDVAASREEFLEFVRSRNYDVVLSDYRMPGATGQEVYQAMKAEGVDIPFILVTGSLGDEKAVECLKQGMADYVIKDRLVRLPVAVGRAIEDRRLLALSTSAQEALRRSEASYRSLVEKAPCGIIRAAIDDGRFLEANPAFVEMLGYEREADVLKLDVANEVYVDRDVSARMLREYSREGKVWSAEVEWRRKDGSIITVELGVRPVPNRELGACLELTANDVTARKRSEERVRQLNRLYSVSSRVSQAIVRIRHEGDLLREICRIIVEEGQFRMVWVGLVEEETLQIRPAVHWGAEDGYLASIDLAMTDDPAGWGPARNAIGSGEHFLCQNIEVDPGFPSWQEEAQRRGYGSAGGFPLKWRGRTAGVIALYACGPG